MSGGTSARAGDLLRRDLGRPGGVGGFCRDLVRIPSPSGREEAVIRRIADEMRALGLDVTVDAAGNAVGRVRSAHASRRESCILLCSHADHVDEGDASAWTHPPFDGFLDGDRLHGRGASDAKSCVAAQVHAAGVLLRLRDEGTAVLRHDVVVAAVVQEEVGGLGAALLLESGIAPAAAIVGEPSGGQLAFGHRGRVEVEVRFQGIAAHASRPHLACSPHPSVARCVLGIDDLAHDEVPRMGRSSAAATSIGASPSSVNVIPEEIRLTIDWRHVPTELPEVVVERVRELAERAAGPGVRVKVGIPRIRTTSWTGAEREIERVSRAFATSPDSPLFEAARAALASGLARDVEAIAWGFASDGGLLEAAGARCVGYGPGDMSAMHVRDESVDLRMVDEAVMGNVLLACALDESLARGDA